MKRLLYSLFVAGLLLACNQTDTSTAVNPTRLLYRRWQAVDSGEYITFKSLNYILYGPDGTLGSCCGPRFFSYHDNLIDFKHGLPVPLPLTVKPVNCAAVDCIPIPDSWTVSSLTISQLILQTPSGRRVYKAA